MTKTTNYLKKELYELIKTDETIFDFIQHSSLDGLWYWDLENLEEEWMNPKFWSVLGYDYKEMPHKSSAWQDKDIIHPEDLKKAKENLKKHCENPNIPYDQTVRYQHKNGSTVWIRCRGMAIRDKNGKPIRMLGAHQDITEIKSKTYKQALIMEGANLGSWEWNVQTGETFMDEKWADVIGYKLEELTPFDIESWEKMLHPNDLKEARRKLDLCFEKKIELYEVEVRMKHKDGHWVWVNDRGKVLEWTPEGKPLWMYGTQQDITERKKAEEEIHHTSILLESAQQMGKMGAWELDLATGKTFWTEEVYNIHEVERGFDHNKANGIEFYHPDYRPIITKAIEDSIQKQTPFDVKCKFITAKNNLRWIRSSGYPIVKNGKPTKLIGIFRDITQEENDKKTIAREQAFSKQLLENMADGFSVIDTTGKQTGVNKAFCKMTGFSEEELVGQTAPYPYWPEEEIENIGKALKKVLEGRRDSSFELTFKKKNEERFPVLLSASVLLDESENPISYFANIKDITERKIANDAIRKSRSQLQSILDNTLDVIWSVSMPDFKVILVSPSVEKVYGYSVEEWFQKGNIWQTAIHHKDQHLLDKIMETLKNEGSFDFEYRIVTKAGQVKWIKNKAKIIFDENQQPIRLDGVVSDISKRKKAEEELTKTKDFLFQAGQVAKVGGWDLNNLTGKITWSDTICDIHEVPHGYEPTYEQMVNFYTPESWLQLEKAIQEAINNGTPYDLELKINTAKGKEIWVRAIGNGEFENGKCIRLFGILQDISIQKEAEQMIVKSKEQYQSLVNNIPGITFRYKYDKEWTMLYASSQINDITGYSVEELIHNHTTSYGKLIHEEDRDEVMKNVEKAIAANSSWEIEYRIAHKNGSIRWVYEKGTAVRNQNEILYLDGFALDITDRKNAEKEIKYQKQILDSLYHLSPIGIALNDYETGAFVDANDKLLEPTGYTQDELLSLSYWDVTPKEYADLEAIAMKQMETKRQYETFEKEYIRKDGSRYPVSLQGVLVKDLNGRKLIWSFVRDISKEKEAERKLKEAISKLQAVLNASKQVSIIATDTQGVITLFNSGAEQMLGYTAEEMVGKQTPVQLHVSEEIQAQSEIMAKQLGKEINDFETFSYKIQKTQDNIKEWTYVHKNGHRLPVLLSINTITLDDTIIGYLRVATDISKLKEVEQEIRSLLEIADGQNERLKNFAHIVSHNLRSHSAGISGIVELIKIEEPEFIDNELLTLLSQGTQALNKTIEELTEIIRSNLSDEPSQSVDIHKVVNKNIKSLAFQLSSANVKVINKLPSGLTVKGVKAYIDSIALNMITNAIKYRREERESFLKIYCKEEGSTVSLYFQDNGLGIDLKKYGHKIFGMHSTFHEHEDSRGVGLFITKNQIENMGGKITVKSKVNVGTTFEVILNK